METDAATGRDGRAPVNGGLWPVKGRAPVPRGEDGGAACIRAPTLIATTRGDDGVIDTADPLVGAPRFGTSPPTSAANDAEGTPAGADEVGRPCREGPLLRPRRRPGPPLMPRVIPAEVLRLVRGGVGGDDGPSGVHATLPPSP